MTHGDGSSNQTRLTRRELLVGAAALGLTAGVPGFLASCGGKSQSTGAAKGASPRSGGHLVIVQSTDADTFNNTEEFLTWSIWEMYQMYETLYQVSPDGKTLVPALALGHTVSSDSLVWTFDLRRDVKFSDGQPMTAADVKFSIDAASAASNGWGFINTAIDAVEAPDDHTVVVKTKYPWAPLLSDLSLFSNAVLPKNYGGASQKEFYAQPVATGPFALKNHAHGRGVDMIRNRHYWRPGKPYLDSVSWQAVKDDNTRLLMVQSGEAQIDTLPSWSQVKQLKAGSTPNVQALLFDSTRSMNLGFNETKEPFQDVHVRRALSYAIDRQAIVDAVLKGYGTVSSSLFTPSMPFYDKDAGGQQYDLDLAKQELAKSSVPNGFSTELVVRSGDAETTTAGQVIQSQLAALNIKVKIVQEDPATEDNSVQTLKYPLSIIQWYQDIIDPDELVSFTLVKANRSQGFYTGYYNAQLESLALKAGKTLDDQKRAANYATIQEQLASDAFMAFLYTSPFAYATTMSVNGFHVTPMGNYHLEDVWLAG